MVGLGGGGGWHIAIRCIWRSTRQSADGVWVKINQRKLPEKIKIDEDSRDFLFQSFIYLKLVG